MDLRGKVVVVTGASSGIGEAAAKQFAGEGAKTVLTSERQDDLNRVATEISAAGGTAHPYLVDFSKPDQVEGLIGRIEREVGSVDVLVNNAGVGLGSSLLDTKPADMRFLFEVNFFALATLCREALASMAQRKSGHIINVSSAAGRFGSPGVSAYSATKGAVHAYTQALRTEAVAMGVSVSEVLPISVRTKFFDNAKGNKYRPGGIVLTTEKVAGTIVNCAKSDHPAAEILPYMPVKFAFVLDALMPGILAGLSARNYHKTQSKP